MPSEVTDGFVSYAPCNRGVTSTFKIPLKLTKLPSIEDQYLGRKHRDPAGGSLDKLNEEEESPPSDEDEDGGEISPVMPHSPKKRKVEFASKNALASVGEMPEGLTKQSTDNQGN